MVLNRKYCISTLAVLHLVILIASCTDYNKEKLIYSSKAESDLIEIHFSKERESKVFLNIESSYDDKLIRSYWKITNCDSIKFRKMSVKFENHGIYLNIQKTCTLSDQLSIRNCKSTINDLIPDINNYNTNNSNINLLVELNSNGVLDSLNVTFVMSYEIGSNVDSLEKKLTLYPKYVEDKIPVKFH